jgi:hypothetical protein
LRESVARNLHIDGDELNGKRVSVTRHHWTRPLLEEVDDKKLKWTTPLSSEDAAKFLHVVEDSEKMRFNNKAMYTKAPNAVVLCARVRAFF